MKTTSTQIRAVRIGPEFLIPELLEKQTTLLGIIPEHRDENEIIRLKAKAAAVKKGADDVAEAVKDTGDYDTAYSNLLEKVSEQIATVKPLIRDAAKAGTYQGLCIVRDELDYAL